MKNENNNNLLAEEIELVFKASCNATPEDRYRNLVDYLEKTGIRINEVIRVLNNNPEFSIDEFEGYILYSKKEDFIFQLKLRREAMLKKAKEAVEVIKLRKGALNKEIEKIREELKSTSAESEKRNRLSIYRNLSHFAAKEYGIYSPEWMAIHNKSVRS